MEFAVIKPAYACTLRRVCISCSLLRNGTTGTNYQSELVAISRRQSVDIKTWVERIEGSCCLGNVGGKENLE